MCFRNNGNVFRNDDKTITCQHAVRDWLLVILRIVRRSTYEGSDHTLGTRPGEFAFADCFSGSMYDELKGVVLLSSDRVFSYHRT